MFVKLFSASLDFSTQANNRCGAHHGRRVNLRSGAPSTEDPQRTPPWGSCPQRPVGTPRADIMNSGSTWGAPRGSRHVVGDESGTVPAPPGARGAPQRRATPPRPGHAEIMCLFPETKTLAKWESTPRKRDCIEERDFSKVLPAHFVKGFGRKFFPGTDRASPPRRDASLRAAHRVLPVDLARANVRTF